MCLGRYFNHHIIITPETNIPEIFTIKNLTEGQIFLFDKPYQWSSFKLVNDIRYKLCKKNKVKKLKVGHAGTLDPLATGLMIIGTGKATKLLGNLTESDKEYIAELKLGETTPSYDRETDVNAKFETNHITGQLIEESLKKFTGKIKQTPPLFSAKKVDGTRAYELARNGMDHQLKSVLININDIKILEYHHPLLKIKVNCSKGTYIRSLANDIGISLKSGAHLNSLKRTAIGDYTLDAAWTLDEFYKKIIWM